MSAALLSALIAITDTSSAAVVGTDIPVLTISPDRPRFADSTQTVPPGHAQIELGVRADFDDAPAFTAPSILVRVGVTDFIEARVSTPDLQLTLPSGGDPVLGVSDMVLGVKIAGSVGHVFSVSAVPYLLFPTGSPETSSGIVEGGAGLNFQVVPFDDFSIGWNVIGAFVASNTLDKRLLSMAAGLSFGYAFTESFGAFAESYVQYQDGGKGQPSVAGGLTFLPTPRVQIDLSGGSGLTDEAESPYAIVGVAALF
jgi:hypothetical protein